MLDEVVVVDGFMATVRWKVKLDSGESSAVQPNHKSPWWLPVIPQVPPVADALPNDSSSLSILVESLEGVPERPWWHCTGCGKLNVKQMFIHRRCSHCPVCTHFSHRVTDVNPSSGSKWNRPRLRSGSKTPDSGINVHQILFPQTTPLKACNLGNRKHGTTACAPLIIISMRILSW